MTPAVRWLVATLALGIAADARAAPAEEAASCATLEVEYALSPTVELSDTPKGQGNGTYRIGPGTAVVRFKQRGGAPSGPATLVKYETTEHIKIKARALFWKTTVTTDSRTTVAKDACGVIASGDFSAGAAEWSSPVRGARTDGVLNCDGSLCGKFGAPPPGISALHVPPHDVRFQRWVFSPDLKTFTMAKTWMSHSDAPRQTARVSLAGQEVRRRCVKPPPCPR